MRSLLVCESCDMGYPSDMEGCPFCGAGAWLAHTQPAVRRRFDTECYPDYWLCQFTDPSGISIPFQLFPGHPLDIDGMRQIISTSLIVGFNSRNYDIPMVSAAMMGWDNISLKQLNDAIILQGLKPWDIERQFGIHMIECDHIDLIEVAPGQASLKAYGGKMHSKKLQDLPYDPSDRIDWVKRILLREYCDNDLTTTGELDDMMSAQLKLREEMSAEYGVDLRSKSDAQIAEAAMIAALPFKVQRPADMTGATFKYRPPAWLHFVKQPLLDIVAGATFRVAESGSVEMPKELSDLIIRMGKSAYRMGIGGLHSTEQRQFVRDNEHWVLADFDVASYYPSLMLGTGVYPPQIGPAFQEIYKGWIVKRLKAKHRAQELEEELKVLQKQLAALP